MVKVFFQLEPDEDGYPPASVESVWARVEPGTPGLIIENTPFFARQATLGDTVSIRWEEGVRWFESVVERSTNSLVRVAFWDPACLEPVNDALVKMGCVTEYTEHYQLLAVSIPGEVSLLDVQEYLQGEAGRGGIDYEEPILRQ